MTLNLDSKSKMENVLNKKIDYVNFRYFEIIKIDDYTSKMNYWIEKHLELKNKFLQLKKTENYNYSLFDNEISSLLKEYYIEFPSIELHMYNYDSRFGEICDIIDDLKNQPNFYKLA